MIEVEKLQVHYGADEVLKDISLSVAQGEICVLIGPSGCGKSTLIRTVAGLLPPSAGAVRIHGEKIDLKRQKIGFMPQGYGLLPWKKLRENICMGRMIRGEEIAEQELSDFLARLGLEGLEDRYPRELSGGQQQRAALARVFLLHPDLLLMDEPFSALDVMTREAMQEVFLELWRTEAITTMLVTHYVEEAILLGKKIVRMERGGRIAEILENPLFGETERRQTKEFHEMGDYLRRALRSGEGAA